MVRCIPFTYCLLICGALIWTPSCVHAQAQTEIEKFRAPDQSVSELSDDGEHLAALVKYEETATDRTLADNLAAARSAWALGLTERSRAYWDLVFSDTEFKGPERARSQLARAILELQEGRFEDARSVAERAARDVPASQLRAQLWLVIAEALRSQNALSLSEGYYKRAIEEGDRATRNEAAYLLGETQLKLGMVDQARYSFTSIETRSPYAARGLRRLAEIDMLQRNYDGVLTWIDEGRDNQLSETDDDWSAFAYVSALVHLGRNGRAREEQRQMELRFSPKNGWVVLAAAAIAASDAEHSEEALSGSKQLR
jgi:tetratricopeptide (TPR) repeat protein